MSPTPDPAIERVARCPTLETERLILRAHAVADFADCASMWADPDVVRHIGGLPAVDGRASVGNGCCATSVTGSCSASASG